MLTVQTKKQIFFQPSSNLPQHIVALSLGIGRLILETVALMVKQALCSFDFDATPAGGLICELKSLVHSIFLQFECIFKSRDCNCVAHALAELGYECVGGEEIISNSIPCNIPALVAADVLADE